MNLSVAQVWRYPVKSMIGEIVPSAELGETGMLGDRAWAVRDEVRGGIRGAKKIASLMQVAARTRADGSGHVDLTLPDGTVIGSDAAEVAAQLSAALQHDVTLWPLLPADQLDHYRRGRPDTDDVLAELRQVFGRTEDEPLPDFSQFPPVVMEYESPPGTYVDAWPVMVMTTSALAALRQALPDSNPDVRRFRPNLVIDTGDEPGHPEFAWVGRTLRVGSAELSVVGPCPRCVMVTRRIDDDVPEDRAVLRHIVRELDQNVGVYAAVTTPGRVSAGDPVVISGS